MGRQKQFATVRDYLVDRWETKEGFASVKQRFDANDDFMAGWLTAHTTIDSNQIKFINPAKYAIDIAEACKEFVK